MIHDNAGGYPLSMATLAYNSLLLLVDTAVLTLQARRGNGKTAVGLIAGAGFASLLLAVLLGENLFGILRLLCFALFLHGPLLLGTLAAMFWKKTRAGALTCAITALLSLMVAADAFLIEPHWLQVSHVALRSPKLRRPLRIAVIADFQTDHLGDYERSVIERTLQEKPDLLLMAGDHLQAASSELPTLRRELRRLLKDLAAAVPLGVYAVRGNIDPPDWATTFEGMNVTTFESTRSLDLADLRLTGLGMDDSFNSNLSLPESGRFQIVLGHSPDFSLGKVPADLLIAGHTHGGQVRLPLIGPLMTLSRIPRSWAAGVTPLDERRILVVSRGIGMERGAAPRLRFFCRPELVVIDVTPQGP